VSDEFKVKVAFEGDASGAVAAAEQTKAAIAGVQGASAAAPGAASESPAPAEQAASAEDAAKAEADLNKELTNTASAAGTASTKVHALTGVVSLIDPVFGRIVGLGHALKESIDGLMKGGSSALQKGAAVAGLGIAAIGAMIASGIAAMTEDLMREYRKFMERMEEERKAAFARRSGARGITAMFGMDAGAAAEVGKNARDLEQVGFTPEVAMQAAAIAKESGLSRQEALQVAAGLKTGAIEVGKTRRERTRNLERFRRSLLGDAAGRINRGTVEATFADRLEAMRAAETAEDARADDEARADVAPWVRQALPNVVRALGYKEARPSTTPQMRSERVATERLIRNQTAPVTNVHYYGNVFHAPPPRAERRQLANED
jgi:hypothetical protein